MHREFTVGYCRAVGERAGVTAWTGGVGGSSCRTCTQKACTYCKTPPWIYSGPFREIRCEKIKDRFAGSHCFCKNVKKRTQNYAYSVSSRIVTDANEIFFERESDRNDFFPYFSQLQSVYYANLRNQPFPLARVPRRLGRLTTRRRLLLSKRPKRRG